MQAVAGHHRHRTHTTSGFQKLEPALLAPIDEAFADSAVDPEDEIQCVRAEFSDLNDLCDPSRICPTQTSARLYVFEVVHVNRVTEDTALNGGRGTTKMH